MQCSQPPRPDEDAENQQPIDQGGFGRLEQPRGPSASSQYWFRDEIPSPRARRRTAGEQLEVRGNRFRQGSARARLQLTVCDRSRKTPQCGSTYGSKLRDRRRMPADRSGNGRHIVARRAACHRCRCRRSPRRSSAYRRQFPPEPSTCPGIVANENVPRPLNVKDSRAATTGTFEGRLLPFWSLTKKGG